MASKEESIIMQVRAALENEPRVNLHRCPLEVSIASGAVVLEGEVDSIAAKKLALRRAAAIFEVRGVVDRLRVAPSQRRGDAAIRDSLRRFLLEAPELSNCSIRVREKGRVETLRALTTKEGGQIEAGIDEGVITFEGAVISLSHKRLVGVLAWWTPGCCDVVNSLDIVPDEEDNDGEIIDALGLVLEMDPLVHSERITASCRDDVVTLSGIAGTEEERRRAEFDAWALFAVDQVVNEIEVIAMPAAPSR